MYSSTFNCPQCGNELPLNFRHSKLVVCSHCSSTLFLEDEALRLAGQQSVLADLPSLVQLQLPFSYRNTTYLPVGHIRYRYSDGFWDEWWVLDGQGEGSWLSVDEGEFAFEQALTEPLDVLQNVGFERLKVGSYLDQWLVTERDQAVCEGFRGELPEIIEVGETFDYVHLSGRNSELITLEFVDEGIQAYQGQWVNPFEIKGAT